MDDVTAPIAADRPAPAGKAFEFYGDWRQFAPIAFTNLLLTIVTLGIYHFWGKTRVRRYLWSNSRFIDDRLEWTGTGLELFIGYILAVVLFVIPFGVINLITQGVLMRGHEGAAALIVLIMYFALMYLFGVAVFRALRYRLSRTYWHGIRGGSDDPGFRYGLSYMWRSLVGMLPAGLMVPWSMTTLWNRRWNRMSFGPMQFRSEAEWQPLLPRFLLFYLAPIIVFVGGFALIALFGNLGGFSRMTPGAPPTSGQLIALLIAVLLLYAIFFGVLGIIAMVFYSAYFREAVGNLSLGDLEFEFTADTTDWIKLYLGNFALVAVTFGVGYIFLAYRNWAFFMRHMAATGSVELDRLTRSHTREPGQGEGLLDAFDVGAF